MATACDRDFIDSVAFVVGIYKDRHLLMAGKHDSSVRLLAFVFGHDAAWIAEHVTARLNSPLS